MHQVSLQVISSHICNKVQIMSIRMSNQDRKVHQIRTNEKANLPCHHPLLESYCMAAQIGVTHLPRLAHETHRQPGLHPLYGMPAAEHLALTLMNSSKAMRLSLLESTFSMTLRISALLTLRPSPSESPARLFSSTSISRESRLPLPLLSTCTRSRLFRVCLSSLQRTLL